MMKSVEDPAVLEARRIRVEENIKNKIDLEQGRRENWEARKAQQQSEYNWFVAKFFMVMIPLFLVGACTYNVATSEPEYVPSKPIGSTCVENTFTGCRWDGSEYTKSFAD